MPGTSFMGATIRRREDPRLITGSATYVDDVQLPRMAYLGILRSTHPHARITHIDMSKVREHPAVLAWATAADVTHLTGSPSSEERESEEEGGGE